MTTTITKTIKTSGGDYTTLTAWEAANQGDLVALDQIQQAECYAGAFTDSVSVQAWVTGPSNYIRIYTPLTERHNGTSRDVSGIGFQLRGASAVMTIVVDHIRLEGLNIKSTANVTALATAGGGISVANDVRVTECIIEGATTTAWLALMSNDTDLILTMRNCVIYNAGNGSALGAAAIKSATIQHCTIIGTGSGFACEWGPSAGQTHTLNNNYVASGSNLAFHRVGSGGTVVASYNASSDATGDDPGATGALINKAVVDQFVSIGAGTEDFHLKAGSALIGAGTPLAAVPLDIVGTTRSLTVPDIGGFEYVIPLVTASGTDTSIVSMSDVSTLAPYLLLRPDGDL